LVTISCSLPLEVAEGTIPSANLSLVIFLPLILELRLVLQFGFLNTCFSKQVNGSGEIGSPCLTPLSSINFWLF
jgi:hypothetical protein